MANTNRDRQDGANQPARRPVTLDDVYGGFRKIADQAARDTVQKAIDALDPNTPR